MLYILLSWLYVFFCASVVGTGVNKIFKLQNKFVITQLLGFFAISIVAAYFAVFYKIGILFHLFLVAILLLVLLTSRNAFVDHLRELHTEVVKMNWFCKISFGVLFLLILAQCASSPYVIDNETYYIQTIKWLNEYGYVPGLGNLHFYFAQTSGWHILQSVFNLNFLYPNFNDLSGYCLILGNLFAFQKLSLVFVSNKKKPLNLAIGLLPLGNILLFQFISAPSPDLPVLIISFLIFYFLLKNFPQYSKSDFISISMLCFFVLFIKSISVFLVAVPIFMLWSNYKKLISGIVPIFFVGGLTLIIFLIKNQLLTGYPLYPLDLFHFNSDYSMPAKLMNELHESTKLNGYLIGYNQYLSMSIWERFIYWLQLPGLTGIFNKIMMVLLIGFPFFLRKTTYYKPLAFIYFLGVANMMILFLTSPQYRFFLVFILFFMGILLAHYLHHKNLIKSLQTASIFILIFLLFVPFSYSRFTENELMTNRSIFKKDYLISPHKSSQYSFQFNVFSVGNLNYYSPPKRAYIWVTGDGQLPCVNKKQINFFKRKLQLIPQLRNPTRLEEGFFSLKLSKLNEK